MHPEVAQHYRRKNSMSWLDIKVWLQEEKEKILNAYIDEIYIIDNLIILKLKNVKYSKEFLLIIEPGKRINTSELKIRFKDEYIKSSSLWKSILKNCNITDIEQYDNERILFMNLKCYEKNRKIAIELLPRGVVAILDDNNTILLASKYKKMRDRIIMPKLKYILPPKPINIDYDNITADILKNLLLNDYNVVPSLVKSLDIPPEIAEAIDFLCKLNNKRVLELTSYEYECIAVKLKELLKSALEKPKPCIVYRDSIMIGFYSFIPIQFYEGNYNIEYLNSLNETIEKYFSESFKSLLISKKIQSVANEIEKLKNSVEMIDRNLTELKSKKENLENVLKVLNELYIDLENIHECVRNRVKNSKWEDVKKCSDFIINLSPDKGLYKVGIKNIEIELDVRKTFVENYYTLQKSIADLDKSIRRALEEKKNIEIKINELNRIIQNEIKEMELKLSKKIEWYEKFHWMISSKGFLIIGGRDASQNIKLIRRYLEPHDIVLHADIHGASVIIVKTNKKEIDEETLKEVAVFAASYSKAWKIGLASINVYWVYGSQVSLRPPSGEYLPKGSFMIYGKKNYINNVELKLAIGVEAENIGDTKAIIRVFAGPEDLVKEKAIAYMVLIPGNENPETISKMFLENIRNNLRNIIVAINPKDIEVKIPGRSKVIKLVVK